MASHGEPLTLIGFTSYMVNYDCYKVFIINMLRWHCIYDFWFVISARRILMTLYQSNNISAKSRARKMKPYEGCFDTSLRVQQRAAVIFQLDPVRTEAERWLLLTISPRTPHLITRTQNNIKWTIQTNWIKKKAKQSKWENWMSVMWWRWSAEKLVV